MQGLFITGTDTGAGKTYLAAALARSLRRRGRVFRVCKPVATGAEACDGGLLSEDTRRLAEAAGDPDPGQVTPFAFAVPAAPPVAARHAGTNLTLAAVAAAVRRASAGVPVLVEGVGGLLCPLTERETVADLAADLGLPLVVVARRSLGTLNHTLMTLEVARRRGLAVAGLVVSATAPVCGIAEETNVEELRRRAGVPLLAVLPYQPDSLGDVAAVEAVDWWGLMTGHGT